MYIFILNRSDCSVLFHIGDGNYKVLNPAERTSVLCSEQGMVNVYVKHTHGSSLCEPEFRYSFERIAHSLDLKQQKDYHLAICSVYTFTGLRDMDEITITHKMFNIEKHALYNCLFANCNEGTMISANHEVADGEYIKLTYKKKRRNMVLWHFTIGFLLDAGICSLGFWILAAVVNVIDNPNELPFWGALAGLFFLITLIPNIVNAVKEYKTDKFLSYMTTQSISRFIFGQVGA